MSDQTNNDALNSINPLAYMGVNPKTPPNFLIRSFPPTPFDSKNVQIGALWLSTGNSNPPMTPPTLNDLYVLVALYQGQATWLPFTAGDLRFLQGNSGGPVPPTPGNLINVVGDGTTVTVVGTPGTSTLTISLVGGGVAAQSFPTDSGTATPNGSGVLNVFGDTHNVTTTGSGNTITVGLTGITQHSLQVGGLSNALTQLGVASNGQLPIGSVGADPVLATLTAGSGISIINSPGSITIASSSTPASAVQFSAYKSADATNATGNATVYTIVCDTVVENVGGGYNNGTGVFTAPISGLYYFMCIVDMANIGAAHTIGLVEMGILGTPNFYHSFDSNPFDMATSSSAATSLVYEQTWLLNAGDAIGLQVGVAGGTKTVTVQGAGVSGNRGCYFNGFLIGGASATSVTGLLAQDGNTVTPTAGVIQASGAGNISTTGTVGPNTLTVHYTPTSSFSALWNAEANITGDGTIADLGATVAATVQTNVGSNFSPGNGAGTGASFTAPATGLYYFYYYVSYSVGVSATDGLDFSMGFTGSSGFNFSVLPTSNKCTGFSNGSGHINTGGSCMLPMTIGDIIQFTVQSNGTAKNLTVDSGTIGGYRIS